MFKKLTALVFALGLLLMQSLPAAACGGLIAPNGSVRLARAATLIAWHDGIEHYMTSFLATTHYTCPCVSYKGKRQ